MKYSVQTTALPPESVALPQLDSLVKTSRPVSTYRDAAFMRDLEGLLESGHTSGTPMTSVCKASTLHPSHPLHPSTPSPFTLPRHTPSLTSHGKAGARRRSRVLPWWRSTYLAPPVRAHRVPADWRDASPLLTAHYVHLALRTFGPVHSFSLNLRPDVEAQARLQADECDWLYRRIARELKKALGRKVEFVMMVEETDDWTHRLHVHGEVQCSADEAKAARKALRAAGGEWKAVRQHQAHTDENPDDGWIGYCAKGFWKFDPHTRRWNAMGRSFMRNGLKGRPFAASKGLRRAAAGLYAEHRRIVWRHRYGRAATC